MKELKKTEVQANAKKQALSRVDLTDAIQIDTSEYAVKTVVEGYANPIWVKIKITAANDKATKVNPAFDPEVAAQKYREKVEDARLEAEAKAAKAKRKVK